MNIKWLNSGAIRRLNTDNDQGYTPDTVIQTTISNLFTTHIVANKGVIHNDIAQGTIADTLDNFNKIIDSFGGKLVFREYTKDSSKLSIFVHNNFVLKMRNSCDGYGSPSDDDKDRWVEIFTDKKELVDKFGKEIAPLLIQKIERGNVFALAATTAGLKFTDMGKAGSELVRDNYTKAVQESYDQIVEDLKSKKPSGRLAILDGPAGSGKTHLVKALLSEIEGMFVLVSAESIHELANPQIVPLLVEHKKQENIGDKPMIFILEDADSALVPRDSGNMGLISSLLNYTDGIFGALFDLRVVATTNAKKFQIEEALLRAGRLSCQVTVDLLPVEDANRIYTRLSEDKKFKFSKPTRLADIYAKANGFKITADKSNKITKDPNKLGFSNGA